MDHATYEAVSSAERKKIVGMAAAHSDLHTSVSYCKLRAASPAFHSDKLGEERETAITFQLEQQTNVPLPSTRSSGLG